ncbi:MAG: Mur ligase family protein [Candidatus Shapirobacteria bacterium]|nr:Mur ligase family protein [Candidatus Shapirobacteria bacterium]
MMIVETYKQALEFINNTIPKDNFKKFPGDIGLKRQKLFLNYLGNPQNKIKIVHIAGTSGKGSIASLLSYFLTGHGFKVGLTLSPHILNIRERIQINNKIINENDFIYLTNKIIGCFEKIKESDLGTPTFFEILIAMAYCWFKQNKVDYAIVETGMGGLFDGTNVVESENKISVISRLGMDHMSILGKTIAEITYQKAGIIKNGNKVVSLWQPKLARQVLEKVVKEKNTNIYYIEKNKNYKNIKINKFGLSYDFCFDNFKIDKLIISNFAIYQIENSALALSVLKIVSDRDNFEINKTTIKNVLFNFKFIGRMDIIKFKKDGKEKIIILDGAHNPQKMNSFIDSLKISFKNKKFTFVIAFKKREDFPQMLKKMTEVADNFIITSFLVKSQDMIQTSQPTKKITNSLDKIGFKKYKIIFDSNLAIEEAIKKSDFIVVTSSLYLLVKIYPYLIINNIIQPIIY